MRITLDDRFWVMVEKTDTCWLWLGVRFANGYGRTYVSVDITQRAHILAWMEKNGPKPAGKMLDHLCRVKHCVRPDHLEPVTNAENQKRGFWGQRTHCNYGHEYTPENTHLQKVKGRVTPKRRCRECNRLQQRRRRAA